MSLPVYESRWPLEPSPSGQGTHSPVPIGWRSSVTGRARDGVAMHSDPASSTQFGKRRLDAFAKVRERTEPNSNLTRSAGADRGSHAAFSRVLGNADVTALQFRVAENAQQCRAQISELSKDIAAVQDLARRHHADASASFERVHDALGTIQSSQARPLALDDSQALIESIIRTQCAGATDSVLERLRQLEAYVHTAIERVHHMLEAVLDSGPKANVTGTLISGELGATGREAEPCGMPPAVDTKIEPLGARSTKARPARPARAGASRRGKGQRRPIKSCNSMQTTPGKAHSRGAAHGRSTAKVGEPMDIVAATEPRAELEDSLVPPWAL